MIKSSTGATLSKNDAARKMIKRIMSSVQSLKHPFEFGAILTTISAIVTDVLAPLSMLGIWVAFGFFMAGIILVLKALIAPALWRDKNAFLGNTLNYPLAMCFFIAMAITAFQYQLYSGNAKYANGILADSITIVDAFQEQIGISKEILAVSKRQLDVQTKSLESLVSIDTQVNQSNLTLQRLAEAMFTGNLAYLEQWQQAGKRLSDVYLKRQIVSPPIIMEAILNNHESIDKVLALLYRFDELRTLEAFDANALYVPQLSRIWSNATQASDAIDNLAKQCSSYEDFSEQVLRDFGIEFNPRIKVSYQRVCERTEYSLSYFGNSHESKISLRTFAKIANNEQAEEFLDAKSNYKGEEYIDLNSHKIRLDGDYLSLHL